MRYTLSFRVVHLNFPEINCISRQAIKTRNSFGISKINTTFAPQIFLRGTISGRKAHPVVLTTKKKTNVRYC